MSFKKLNFDSLCTRSHILSFCSTIGRECLPFDRWRFRRHDVRRCVDVNRHTLCAEQQHLSEVSCVCSESDNVGCCHLFENQIKVLVREGWSGPQRISRIWCVADSLAPEMLFVRWTWFIWWVKKMGHYASVELACLAMANMKSWWWYHIFNSHASVCLHWWILVCIIV